MNFALVMLVLLAVTGGIWLLDSLYLRWHRGPAGAKGEPKNAVKESAKEPWWVEYSKSFFPVILVVFLLRSFLVEPFKIPSGSMIPTLLVGDFILVNKYAYGIRLPVINEKVLDVGEPHRGEVMVFRYPENPSLDYIKRVVGVPGDRVAYVNKQLTINGQPLPMAPASDYQYAESGLNYVATKQFREDLNGHDHAILINPESPPVQLSTVRQFPHREDCEYNETGFVCVVPRGSYFMMGDNRDSSSDSRYWGFVPERNIVGKAFLIWWNFSDLGRIGRTIN